MRDLELLARQHGLIGRDQALDCGLSTSSVTRRIRSGQWFPVLPGVYRHAAVTVTDRLIVRATMLWRPVVVSGSWAAWWHGLRPEPVGPLVVTAPRSSGARSWHDVRVRRRDLSPVDVARVDGVRVVSRPLAALENARFADGQDVVDRALQRRVSLIELDRAMARFSNASGATAVRQALSVVQDGTVSPPERELATALRAAGLRSLRAGVTVWANGRRCWLDFADERARVAVEVDGVAFHSDPAAVAADRERQNALVSDGWTVLRYTPAQIRRDGARVVAEIAAVLADRGSGRTLSG